MNKKKIALFSIIVLYITILLYLVLFTPARLHHHLKVNPHFIPVKSTIDEIIYTPKYNIRSHYINFAINLFGNILLFMPFGFLFSLISKKRESNKKIILISAFLLSFSIELSQLILNLGVFDVDDILLNILGAWSGIQVYIKIKNYRRSKFQ